MTLKVGTDRPRLRFRLLPRRALLFKREILSRREVHACRSVKLLCCVCAAVHGSWLIPQWLRWPLRDLSAIMGRRQNDGHARLKIIQKCTPTSRSGLCLWAAAAAVGLAVGLRTKPLCDDRVSSYSRLAALLSRLSRRTAAAGSASGLLPKAVCGMRGATPAWPALSFEAVCKKRNRRTQITFVGGSGEESDRGATHPHPGRPIGDRRSAIARVAAERSRSREAATARSARQTGAARACVTDRARRSRAEPLV